jgi:hypothetical protein
MLIYSSYSLHHALCRLPNEQYAVSIELTSGADAVRAFNKFAVLRLDEFMLFGPTLVLRCRSERWTHQLTPRAGIDLHSRTAILRHLTGECCLHSEIEVFTSACS